MKSLRQSSVQVLFFLLFFCSIVFGQDYITNPDGNNVSFHFTPYITDTHINTGATELKSDGILNFNLLIKLPIEDQLTFSVFYNTESNEFNNWLPNQPLKTDKQSYGLTLSFYLR